MRSDAHIVDGDTVNGNIADGDTVNGNIADGDTVNGNMVDGETVNGDQAPPAVPTEAQVAGAVAAFALLADPTRVRLLWLLHADEHDVGTLARLVGATSQATSQHLAKLRLAGLVSLRRQGRNHFYRARDTHVRQLIGEALHHADHLLAGYPDHD